MTFDTHDEFTNTDIIKRLALPFRPKWEKRDPLPHFEFLAVWQPRLLISTPRWRKGKHCTHFRVTRYSYIAHISHSDAMEQKTASRKQKSKYAFHVVSPSSRACSLECCKRSRYLILAPKISHSSAKMNFRYLK